MLCPNCGEECNRDEVDVGVGVITGPWGCYCGWSESEAYNCLTGDGGWQEDGGYIDPLGNYWPKDNPVVQCMRKDENMNIESDKNG